MNDLYAKRMDHFFSSLLFILIICIVHIYYGCQQSQAYQTYIPLSSGLLIIWVWMGGIVFRYSHWSVVVLQIVLSCSILAFYQDWTTQYFSWRWLILFCIVPFFISYCPVDLNSRCLAFVFVGTMGIVVYKGWLGIADFIYLLAMAWVIGFWRMILLLFVSSIIGLLDVICAKKTYIPFISALVINSVWIITLTF